MDHPLRHCPVRAWRCFGCITCWANTAGRTSWTASTPFRTAKLLRAALFTVAGYSCLTLYDALAVRFAGARVPYPRIALISFMGYAIGHNVGFNTLSGGAVRYRAYTALGLGAKQIATIIAFGTRHFLAGSGTAARTVAAVAGGHVGIGAARACGARLAGRRACCSRRSPPIYGWCARCHEPLKFAPPRHSGAEAARGVRADRRGMRRSVVRRQRAVRAAAAASARSASRRSPAFT